MSKIEYSSSKEYKKCKVSDSFGFVNKLTDGYCVVSFDVISLSNNVSLEIFLRVTFELQIH